ncbi:MAG: hypothetical protein ACI8X5_001967 [Planctomycetota bacterium]|jgi:hypothetical protein
MYRLAAACTGLFALTSLALPSFGQCQIQHLVAGDPDALDVFGWGMDLSADRMAVGAIGADEACPTNPMCNSGAVYMYKRNGDSWTFDGKIVNPAGALEDEFGHDLSISGDSVLVSAHKEGSGAAYIYTFDGLSWIQEARLEGTGLLNNFHFGHSLTLRGDTAVVGAMRDEGQGFETGSAFVFNKIGGVWTETHKLEASDAAMGDRFGRSSAMEGDVIALASHLHDGIGADSGAVYVYERDDNGTPGDILDDTWPEVAALTASDTEAGLLFGRSVAISGNVMIIGAENGGLNGVMGGCAYIFFRSGNGWVEVEKIAPDDAAAGDRFGISASINGDYALIGAVFDDDLGNNAGAVYVFTRTPSGYFQTGKIYGSDTEAGDQLGHENGVHVVDGTAIISGRFSDAGGANGTGSTYVFDLDDCLGNNYCDITPNSAGPGAEIRAAGLQSISDNTFSVISSGCIPNKIGIFFYGQNHINVPLGNGRLCIGGVARLNPPVIADASGVATRQVDFTVFPAGSGAFQITVGSTWSFQHWFRDTDAGGAGFTFSNGVEVTFIP